jgi:hypothetical protein
MTSTAIGIRDEQDEMLRAQVRDRSGAPLEGEKRLMLAVLERAVDDLRTYANVPTGRGRWLFMEVAGWFDSSETGAFDFEGICEATGLDPDFIRKGLRGGYDTGHPRLHDVSGGNRMKRFSTPPVSAAGDQRHASALPHLITDAEETLPSAGTSGLR